MSQKNNVVIAGGGTGGHLFPGVALAEVLVKKGYFPLFVGTKQGIEARVIPSLGYQLYTIVVRGVKGKSILSRLWGYFLLPFALLQSLWLLIKLRPAFVVGVGGYASFPIVFLASLLRIPTVLLEQNAIPGLSNRWLSKRAGLIFTSFPQASMYFPKDKVRCYGNPIRSSLERKSNDRPQNRPLQILVLGGSLGAHAINETVAKLVELLVAQNKLHLFYITHQCGLTDAALLQEKYQSMGVLSHVVATAFIDDMAKAYSQADFVIARAGATTLAELTYVGLPALLIPYPWAADDHQTHNAKWLEENGAAKLFSQKELTAQMLFDELLRLVENPLVLQRMSQASFALGQKDTAVRIVDEIERRCSVQ